MDVAFELADFISRTQFEDLPDDVIEVTKEFLFDTMAVLVAGSTAQGCQEVIDLFRSWGGRPEGTILVYGDRVPCVWAGFANSMMIHARDFDDTHDEAGTHAFVSVLPAALAAAEYRGSVDGKAFITATSLSVELMCRLGLAAINPMMLTGWDFPAASGAFGAAAAAAKVLNYNFKEIVNTWGIAYSNIAGTCQVVVDSSLTKRMQPAYSVKNGLLAALFSAKGISGVINVFEGKYGYFNQYEGGKYIREELTKELGSRYELLNLSKKPYPCCRYPHASIDATLSLVRRDNFSASDIEKVNVYVPKACYEIVGAPFEIKGNPIVDAQFSIPYTVAAAILRKDVTLSDFEEELIRDPKIAELAGRVVAFADASLPGKGATPATVEIILKNGNVLKQRVDHIKGSRQNPMSNEEMIEKFEKCLPYSIKPFPEEKMLKVVNLIKNLETVRDIRDLVKKMVCS